MKVVNSGGRGTTPEGRCILFLPTFHKPESRSFSKWKGAVVGILIFLSVWGSCIGGANSWHCRCYSSDNSPLSPKDAVITAWVSSCGVLRALPSTCKPLMCHLLFSASSHQRHCQQADLPCVLWFQGTPGREEPPSPGYCQMLNWEHG